VIPELALTKRCILERRNVRSYLGDIVHAMRTPWADRLEGKIAVIPGANNEQETTMASNEEIIRNLYAVAEKEPKRFRSLFTKNGYWWDACRSQIPRRRVARTADIRASCV
jgi:hypothetical protein